VRAVDSVAIMEKRHALTRPAGPTLRKIIGAKHKTLQSQTEAICIEIGMPFSQKFWGFAVEVIIGARKLLIGN
jgi:hypothetical protein